MQTPTEKLKEISLGFSADIQTLANVVLDDLKFSLWTASVNYPYSHHYGKGQLAQHTLEVVELSLMNNGYFATLGKGVDPGLLFLAALYHDYGKIKDYDFIDSPMEAITMNKGVPWQSSIHKKKVYHITESALTWTRAFALFGNNLPGEAYDEVLHAILAHHGRYEWKSPVLPQTRMAWILHLSDSLSARVDDVDKKQNMPFSANKPD